LFNLKVPSPLSFEFDKSLLKLLESESQKRKSEIKVLEQKLKSSIVKKDNLCGDLENNVLNQKIYEIEENLENLYFVKARGAPHRSNFLPFLIFC
jgi:hypothetical protein